MCANAPMWRFPRTLILGSRVAEKTSCQSLAESLSCLVRWSTQPLHGYTGLILRQLGCNNLYLLVTNPCSRCVYIPAEGSRIPGWHCSDRYETVCWWRGLLPPISENEPSRQLVNKGKPPLISSCRRIVLAFAADATRVFA